VINCLWSLKTVLSFENKPHFRIKGGNFKCEEMIINSFNIKNLELFKCEKREENLNGSMKECKKLQMHNIVTDYSHINLLSGESSFDQCV
jgi:ATP-dependent helicase/DNAse subunit B